MIADFDRAHPNVRPGMLMQGNCAYEDVLISHNNGTAMYKAPEVCRDSPTKGATQRADMFSLGLVLLEFALQMHSVRVWPLNDIRPC